MVVVGWRWLLLIVVCLRSVVVVVLGCGGGCVGVTGVVAGCVGFVCLWLALFWLRVALCIVCCPVMIVAIMVDAWWSLHVAGCHWLSVGVGWLLLDSCCVLLVVVIGCVLVVGCC